MYQWPLEQIAAMADRAAVTARSDPAAVRFSVAGIDQSLVDFLAPLYDVADGATFFGGALRIYPLAGLAGQDLPALVAWNDRGGWKQDEPGKDHDTFYFCSNAFGDLFGVPVDADGRIIRDRIAMLWVERYEYQEAGIEWRDFFPRLAGEPALANFFLRRDEYLWAAGALKQPAPWSCFSSNVPAVLGGPDTIDNVSVQSLAVHVSFTLQVIRQAQDQGDPEGSLAMADLYDEDGRRVK